MRDFIDGILAFIGSTSLTDDEFATITVETPGYSEAVYAAILAVLDSREALSSTRDRLSYYFMAAGAQVTQTSAGKSNIFLGAGLCS